ncbi:Nucleotidylyl transferase superfamily protein [Forsythia ovata]|uniref:Nucleotidylyl transferase superfamily protein n=1 Tax=Forsythia ovata TaxID=205694 RepID=A0ABD1TAB5_9LAMI
MHLFYAAFLGDGYPCFELSAVNADKPPLTVSQIKERVMQFEKVGKTVIISNQPYFYKKAPKYYGGDYDRMLKILLECKNTGCIFLVGGRDVDGVLKVLDDFDIPEELKDMFISIPVERFRMDISSTEIRRSRGI